MDDFRYQKIIHHAIEEQLRQGKKITLKIRGDSMYPLMRKGEPIQVKKCDPTAVSIGNIITFEREDTYITHRVLWTIKEGNGTRLITKGDNELNVDPPISASQILGKVVTIQRPNRTLDLETPFWRFFNRLLGMIFLTETIFILFYRSTVGGTHPLRTLIPANTKPSLLYRNLKNKSLHLATRIID